jgi:hypothetical protein
MIEATVEEQRDGRVENAELRDELARLHAENARLRSQNRDLRAALDAHVRRAGSAALYGPMEMSAGTCVGPHPHATSREEGKS